MLLIMWETYGVPVMTVFLDGLKVLCLNILEGVFQQGGFQGLLCVPGCWPGLQVFLDGFGDSRIMRRNDLGAVFPVNLARKSLFFRLFSHLFPCEKDQRMNYDGL